MQKNKQIVDKYQVNVETTDELLTMDIEEYIIGVVAGEMPALFHKEALKAQAIASRTYLINHLQSNKTISNTTDDQVYLTEKEMKLKWGDDYEKYYKKIRFVIRLITNFIFYLILYKCNYFQLYLLIIDMTKTYIVYTISVLCRLIYLFTFCMILFIQSNTLCI